MITDPDLVRYACIAHNNRNSAETAILAEFNPAGSSLQELAHQCLQLAPRHHSIFSQTYRKQTYTFVLDDPLVYFGIFDANMIKSDQIRFLGRLKDAINHIFKGNPNQKFTSYCLQGELHPVFHRLMAKSLDFDALYVVPNDNVGVGVPVSSMSKGRKIMALPMMASCKIAKGLKKKRVSGDSVTDSKEALVHGKVDLLEDDDVNVGEVKSRDVVCQNGVCFIDGGVGRQKAKKVWRRHVWIVLVLDLAVCLILFGIWLFVCRGFQCIEG